MINIRKLRRVLERFIEWEERVSINDKYAERKIAKERINIKRKKKMVIEQLSNGNVKAKRKSYIKIEIIE